MKLEKNVPNKEKSSKSFTAGMSLAGLIYEISDSGK